MGERFLDTEEVTGSIPVSPTNGNRPLTSGNAGQGLFEMRAEHVPDAGLWASR